MSLVDGWSSCSFSQHPQVFSMMSWQNHSGLTVGESRVTVLTLPNRNYVCRINTSNIFVVFVSLHIEKTCFFSYTDFLSFVHFSGTSPNRVTSWRSELLDLLPPSPTPCRGGQRASSTGKTKFSWTSLSQLIYWWERFTLVVVGASLSHCGVNKIVTHP